MAKRGRKGLCPSCPKRAECREPCGALEAELSRQCGYQRELPVPAEKLMRLAERVAELGQHWNGVPDAGESGGSSLELSRGQVRLILTRRQARVLELVIWEGLSVTRTAKRLRIHRSGALRRYRNALKRLRQRLIAGERDQREDGD